MTMQASRSAPPEPEVFPLYAYVFFQLYRFVDGHVDMKLGEQCQFAEKRNLASHILLPNRFA
jgi:hypothetical protein